MTPQEIRSQLKELVSDFAKTVAPIYKLLGWEWQPKDVRFIPTEEDIANELNRMIDEVEIDEGEFSLSTGGLKISSEAPSVADTCWHIGLRFELEHEAIVGGGGRSVFMSVVPKECRIGRVT